MLLKAANVPLSSSITAIHRQKVQMLAERLKRHRLLTAAFEKRSS
jgi:hypothetical protein